MLNANLISKLALAAVISTGASQAFASPYAFKDCVFKMNFHLLNADGGGESWYNSMMPTNMTEIPNSFPQRYVGEADLPAVRGGPKATLKVVAELDRELKVSAQLSKTVAGTSKILMSGSAQRFIAIDRNTISPLELDLDNPEFLNLMAANPGVLDPKQAKGFPRGEVVYGGVEIQCAAQYTGN